MQVMTWFLHNQQFGIDLMACREVAARTGVRRVPQAPAYIAGIMNLRGEVLTVLDLRVMLGYDKEPGLGGEAIVRLKDDRDNVALIADTISEVVTIPDEALETRPAGLTESEDKYIRAITRTAAGLIVILNVEHILGGKQ
jgi:purine-binding chemotaxis protein CheW